MDEEIRALDSFTRQPDPAAENDSSAETKFTAEIYSLV
jgi:hypothetical protein